MARHSQMPGCEGPGPSDNQATSGFQSRPKVLILGADQKDCASGDEIVFAAQNDGTFWYVIQWSVITAMSVFD